MTITRLTYYSQNHIDPTKGSAISVLSEILERIEQKQQTVGPDGCSYFRRPVVPSDP